MRIELLHVAACASLGLVRSRVLDAAGQLGLDVTVEETLVTEVGASTETRFLGSPTILVDGRDPFAPSDASPSLTCRLYLTDAGLQGAPSVADLVTALATGPRHGADPGDGHRPASAWGPGVSH